MSRSSSSSAGRYRRLPGSPCGSRGLARRDRARHRLQGRRLVRPERPRRALVPRRRARRALRLRGRRGVLAARDEHHGPRTGRGDGDVPLGGRPGELPRRVRGRAPDHRGRGTTLEGVGLRPLPAEREAHHRGAAKDRVSSSRSARASTRSTTRIGAATRSTPSRFATKPASRRRRPNPTSRTRWSGRSTACGSHSATATAGCLAPAHHSRTDGRCGTALKRYSRRWPTPEPCRCNPSFDSDRDVLALACAHLRELRADNPVGARFCNGCGAALATTAPGARSARR